MLMDSPQHDLSIIFTYNTINKVDCVTPLSDKPTVDL